MITTYPIFVLIRSLWEKEKLIKENIPSGLIICEIAQIFRDGQISITCLIISQKNMIRSKLSFLKPKAQKIGTELKVNRV